MEQSSKEWNLLGLSEAEVHWRKFLESLIATALLIELDEKRLADGKVYQKG